MTKTFFPFLFLTIFLSVFFIYNFRADASTEYSRVSRQYEENLTKACRAAVDAAALSKDEREENIYETDLDKENATDAFFMTLAQGFGVVDDSNKFELLKQHVPSLCLIDTNGYYMYYNAVYTASDGYREVQKTMTPLNTWGYVTDNQRYFIRYYLSDYVEVTDITSGKTKTGNFYEVYDYFGDANGLKVLESRETFEIYKRDFIISDIISQMEYYINNFNQSVNRVSSGKINDYDIHYTFELPQAEYEDWCNLLDQPSAMALLQGEELSSGDAYLNVYAMTGGEVDDRIGYYVDDTGADEYYHKLSCLGKAENYHYRKTKEECARLGYFPCEICDP